MGISPGWFDFFLDLHRSGELKRGDSMLDIGASELFYSHKPEELNEVLTALGAEPYGKDELATMANRSFAAGLFRRAGFHYSAVDYADFPGIIRVDLNLESLPEEHFGKFQFVANSGTSEHILNQYNVFKVIHDAAAPGAFIYHGVPGWGEYEHGIIQYSPKFFWALATANDYEIRRYWGWSSVELEELRPDIMRQIDFPRNRPPRSERVWLHILFRKRGNAPFRGLNDPAFSSEWKEPDRVNYGVGLPESRDESAETGQKAPRTAAAREKLLANCTFYVRADGSDRNNGLVNSADGAFATLQKAADVARGLDFNGFMVTIQIGDGTYTSGVMLDLPLSSGSLVFQGNCDAPDKVLISVAGVNAFQAIGGATFTVKDLKIQSTRGGNALYASRQGTIYFSNIDFGACASPHIYADRLGFVQCEGNYTISGGADAHLLIALQGGARISGVTVTTSGTPAFSTAFAAVSFLGCAQLTGNTYGGTGATGKCYDVQFNGVLQLNGAKLPGGANGTAVTGGIAV